MNDAEANYVWDTWPEYRSLFGTVEKLSVWLDEPGTFYEAQCFRRTPDGEWVFGQNYSVRYTRRQAIVREGLLIIEREIWAHELEVLNMKQRRSKVLKSTE